MLCYQNATSAKVEECLNVLPRSSNIIRYSFYFSVLSLENLSWNMDRLPMTHAQSLHPFQNTSHIYPQITSFVEVIFLKTTRHFRPIMEHEPTTDDSRPKLTFCFRTHSLLFWGHARNEVGAQRAEGKPTLILITFRNNP